MLPRLRRGYPEDSDWDAETLAMKVMTYLSRDPLGFLKPESTQLVPETECFGDSDRLTDE